MNKPKRYLQKVVSGGQTGADIGGLVSAKKAGLETGGWAPLGWATENGPAPWLTKYGLAECLKPGYQARTEANVRDSDGTIWFGNPTSAGYKATAAACRAHGKPFFEANGKSVTDVVTWLEYQQIKVLNVAGNRASKNPGIFDAVESFLFCVFHAVTQADFENNQ